MVFQKVLIAGLLVLGHLLPACAEQFVDKGYQPKNRHCSFCQGKAPIVAVDAAHFNYHSIDNRFQPFANVLRSDGFKVESLEQSFTPESLEGIDILVIANPLHQKNQSNWDLPNYSAFTPKEIQSLYHWVRKGSSLWLIADHLPWAGAASELAAVFGFGFFNGYVEVTGQREQFFSLQQQSLLAHPLLSSDKGSVTEVQGFLGQGFTIPPAAEPILQFSQPAISWMPSASWQIDDKTPYFDAKGLYQGAVLKLGQGRVAVFGEAGMFTAQRVKEQGEEWMMGLNADTAQQNEQFLLNIIHWLAGEE